MKLLYDEEMLNGMNRGMKKAYEAVLPSYGPSSKIVLIQKIHGHVLPTKDGASIINSLSFKDPVEDSGLKFLQYTASKTMTEAGDGTTLTTILAYELFKDLYRKVTFGVNVYKEIEQIESDMRIALNVIDKNKLPVRTKDDVYRVVYSSCKEEQTAQVIAEASTFIGDNGLMTVEEWPDKETKFMYTEGYQFDRGYFKPVFITDKFTQSVQFENPYFLFYEGELSNPHEFDKILNAVLETGRPLVIVAYNVKDEAYNTIVANLKILPVTVVQPQGIGLPMKEYIEDMARFTGGKIFRPHLGDKLARYSSVDILGQAEEFKSYKEHSIIIGGYGEDTIDEYVNLLKSQQTHIKDPYVKERYGDRIAKLDGGTVTIFAGGQTTHEMKERKSRIEDAVMALQSAMYGGYVAGGGVILNQIYNGLPDGTLKRSIRRPLEIMYENRGLRFDDYVKKFKGNKGIDLDSMKVVDMLDKGMVDPANAIRQSIQHAVSGIGTLIKGRVLIVDKEK